MVVIRLARHGSIHKPFYHVTVADRRARRDGTFIERVGFYNPIAKGKAERLRIDLSRVDYWVGQGAQTSQTVSRLVKEARRAEQIGPTEEAVESIEKEAPESAEVSAAEASVEAAAGESSTSDSVEADTSTVVESNENTAGETEVAEAVEAGSGEGAEAATSDEAASEADTSASVESASDETAAEDEKPAT